MLKITAFLLAFLTLTSSVSAFDFRPVNFSKLYQGPVDPAYSTFPAQPPQPIMNLFLSLQQNRSTQGPFRVLWLPYPLWLAQLFYASGTPDTLNMHSLGNAVETSAIVAAFSAVLNNDTTSFGHSIAPFGFKYIVISTFFSDSDPIAIQSVNGAPIQPIGNPLLYKHFLSLQKDIVLVGQTSSYLLYENRAIPNNSSGVMWLTGANPVSMPSETLISSNSGVIQIQSFSPAYSPSEYLLSVNTTKPSWLIFDQTFNSGWVAQVVGQSQPLNHSLAMGWANAFFIPGGGRFDIKLYYEPQNIYNYIWAFSGTLTIGIIALISLALYRGRRTNHAVKNNTPNNRDLSAR